MIGNTRIRLLNVESVQDEETGERVKIITNLTTLLGETSQVGMQTYWSATSNNVKLSCVFVIRKRMYHNQKYVYANKQLYEVNNTAKSSTLNNINLNAVVVQDEQLKEEVENALGVI